MSNLDYIKKCTWKEHPYYEDIVISDNGRVISCRSGKIQELKPTADKLGYSRVNIGHSEHESVHRLVAQTYIPNPEQKGYVNHIDGNPRNNNVWNLEWCTASENVQHALRTGLNRSPKPVRIVETGATFSSMADCARSINGTVGPISNCIAGIRHTYKGYHYELVNNNA